MEHGGIGGSEEAVIYLSEALSKHLFKYANTIYNLPCIICLIRVRIEVYVESDIFLKNNSLRRVV